MAGRESGPYPLSKQGRRAIKIIDALVALGCGVTQAFVWALQWLGIPQDSAEAEEVAQVISQDHPEWFRR